jgi:uncharacterized protein
MGGGRAVTSSLPDPVPEPSTGGKRSSPPKLALQDEVYLIPEGSRYLLYAPFEGTLFSVNGSAVATLRRLRNGGSDAADEMDPFIRQLVEGGILVEKGRVPEGPRFPPKPPHFDPKGLTLCLTTKCTMACTYCYASGGENPKLMRWDTVKAGIDWMIDHLVSESRKDFGLSFHGGGEVTTAPRMFRRASEYARSEAAARGLTTRISAALNGVMGPGMLDWVLENIDSATVSVDGLPEIHNATRPMRNGKGSFDRVAATLHRMDAVQFNYGLRVTVTAEALPRLAESVAFLCSTFKARTIQLEPMFPVGRALANEISVPEAQAFIDQFRKAKEIARSQGRRVRYAGANLGKLTNKFCQVSDDLVVITPDGYLTACYEVGDADDPRAETFFFGHVDSHTGRLEVNYDRLRRIRTLTVEHKPHCADCFCKWHCGGGCAAKLAASGDAWNPSGDPRCFINRELTKDQLKERLHASEPPGSTTGGGVGREERARHC